MSNTVQDSDSSVVADLQLLYSTSVEPDQIDQLGHMNVRFYGVHALAGARELVRRIGLSETDGSSRVAYTDLYTRHYREQLEGAPLEVWGGVLDVQKTDVRLYLELRNPALENMGATFVFRVQQQNADTHTALPLPDTVVDAAAQAVVAWPDHGKPRSVSLDTDPRALSMTELKALGLPGRSMRTITEKHCDADGVFRIDTFQDLVWGSDGISEDDDWLHSLENGEQMGFATMESRCTLFELPRVGARVQSFWAFVELGRKITYERCWAFDVDREVLLCAASFVEVAFNVNTRRAIEIPDFERERLTEHLHPELE